MRCDSLASCRVNYEAVKHAVSLLRGITLGEVLRVEEVDPQYESAVAVCGSGDLKSATSFFLVALAAYRLRCAGEEYWSRFAEFFATERDAENPVESVVLFLSRDSCSSFLRDVKVGRVRKFTGYVGAIGELISRCDFNNLWSLASRVLGSDQSSKTVVFAVKMGYYCGRAMGRCSGPLPMDVPIPVDYRVSKATLGLGLISAESIDYLVSKCRDEVISVWRTIGELVGIPPIHIDALIWALWNPSTLSKAVGRVSSDRAAETLRKLYEAIQARLGRI